MQHGPPLGIHLNAGKTELLMGKHGSLEAASAFFTLLTDPAVLYRLDPARVRFHPDDKPDDSVLFGTRVLGTPIGHSSFVEAYLTDFMSDISNQADCLAKYAQDEPQTAFLLLHNCFSKKVNHLLRTLPPVVFQAHIIAPFNACLNTVVLAILNESSLSSMRAHWTRLLGNRSACVLTAAVLAWPSISRHPTQPLLHPSSRQ
jgi:hypothetical protein